MYIIPSTWPGFLLVAPGRRSDRIPWTFASVFLQQSVRGLDCHGSARSRLRSSQLAGIASASMILAARQLASTRSSSSVLTTQASCPTLSPTCTRPSLPTSRRLPKASGNPIALSSTVRVSPGCMTTSRDRMVATIPVCLLRPPEHCWGNPIGRMSLHLPQLGRMQTESHFASVRTHTAPLCLPPFSSDKQSLHVPMIRKLYLCRRLRCHILQIDLGILSASCARVQCATPRSLASSRCPWTSLLYAGLISYRGHPTAAETW